MSEQVFVTVGSQMPFPRLVDAVDRWLGEQPDELRSRFFGQIGRAERAPEHLDHVQLLAADDYDARVRESSLVVAHAGTGTIFTALRHGVPLLVLARRADLLETRNDHQDATGMRFEERGLLTYARDPQDLVRRLEEWARGEGALRERPPHFPERADGPLVERLGAFFDDALGSKARAGQAPLRGEGAR